MWVACSAAGWSATLPLAFEPNRGQALPGADYVARTRGYAISFTAGRAEFRSHGSRLATVLVGARTNARAEAEAPLPGVVNYLRKDDRSLTGIPTYARVRYRGIYRGVDVVYYGNQGSLEYDFLVAAGADPGRIRLRYVGARGLRVDSAGDLLIQTASGEIRQHRPVVYQEGAGARREIAGRYLLRGGVVRFALGRYDRARPLVIDPALSWATYFDFANADIGEGVAVDAAGNVYLAGSTISSFGDPDAYVAKLNPQGSSVLLQAAFGGRGDDRGHAVAVDSAGNIYVAGETVSSDFPADGTYFTRSAFFNGQQHAFVSKINPTATQLVYSHYVAGNQAEIANAIALDAANNAYIVGATVSTDFPVTTGTAQTTYAGGAEDAFAMRFDASGVRIYGTYLGGSLDDSGNAVAVDSSGNAYITGSTTSTNFKVSGNAYQAKLAGATNAFVTKLSPTGTLVYSTYLGGSGNDAALGIAVDSNGAAYVTGETASTDFPTLNALQKTFGGGNLDIFVSKLSPDGASLAYSTYLGGTGDELANAIALDDGKNAYITGSTSSPDLPLANAFQSTNQGSLNGMVAALDSTGSSLVLSSYLGGNGSGGTGGDSGNAISATCAGGLVVAGTTASTNFPATAGAVFTSYSGAGSDAFVAQISPGGGTPTITDGGVVNAAAPAPGPVAPGSQISIFGSGMAQAAVLNTAVSWPTSLAGATVTINGLPAPILFSSAGQINAQVPYEVAPGPATATVTTAFCTSPPVSFTVVPAAPYIYPFADNFAIVNPDGTANNATHPVHPGPTVFVLVFFTGIGAVDAPVASGAPASATNLSRPVAPFSATLGTSDATVFIALAAPYVGFAQANVQVPANLAPGKYPLTITVGGVASNTASLYVQ